MKVPLRIALLSEYFNLLRGYLGDLRRYAAHACVGYNRLKMNSGQLEGRIIATYHVIEKGLSMPDFRPGFGIPMLKGLIRMIRDFERIDPCESNINIQAARLTLRSYLEKHHDIEYSLVGVLTEDEISFITGNSCTAHAEGGAKSYVQGEYFEHANAPFPSFAKSRHSCRVFDPNTFVDLALIRKAVEIARFSPSVCNRQCWKAHLYQNKETVQQLLELQVGNRGFGHTIPCVIIITAGVKVFSGYAERSQGYLDGGLFGMSLMYALHHQRLGCVPLCWLVPPKTDKLLRKIAQIPDDEIVLMFLGIGHLVSEFSAPASQRRNVEEILIQHEA